jgi:hypothetical protein
MAAAGAGILIAVPPTYEASASDVLLVPARPGSTQAGEANPYLGFGGSLGIVAQITARRMNDVATAEALYAQGATAEYLVDIVPGDAPMLSVTAKSPDEATAMKTAEIVEAEIGKQLTQNQLDLQAPQNLLIVTSRVNGPHAVLKRGSQIRALAGMLAVGMAGTVFLAFAVESLRQRRLRAAAVDKPDEPVDEPGEQPGGSDVDASPQRAVSAPEPVHQQPVHQPPAYQRPTPQSPPAPRPPPGTQPRRPQWKPVRMPDEQTQVIATVEAKGDRQWSPPAWMNGGTHRGSESTTSPPPINWPDPDRSGPNRSGPRGGIDPRRTDQ